MLAQLQPMDSDVCLKDLLVVPWVCNSICSVLKYLCCQSRW